jgi:hypothetical protein
MSDVKGFIEQIELEELQRAEPLHPATLLLSNESWSERTRTSYLQRNQRERGAHYLALRRNSAQRGTKGRNSAWRKRAQKGATRHNSAHLGANRRTWTLACSSTQNTYLGFIKMSAFSIA